jgi:hypothetical protein
MTARWQYLSLVLIYSTDYNPPAPQTWTNTYTIFRPDSPEPDGITGEVTGWTDWMTLLNELGAEGWELSAGAIMDTTVVPTLHGWAPVAIPVRQSYTFKRPTPQ